jgi:hypothetical protein
MDEIDTSQIKGLTKIGLFDQCPHCFKKLNKIPGRKKKCDFCGNFIYVRTRPIDKKRVLVSKLQAQEIENQWEIYQHHKYTKKCPICGTEMHIDQKECYICIRYKEAVRCREYNIKYCKKMKKELKGMSWQLGSGENCEICKKLATQDLYGLGPGVYPIDKFPKIPHYGCNCWQAPELKDELLEKD